MICDYIIKGKYVLAMDGNLSLFHDGAIAVLEDTIIDIGDNSITAKYEAREIIDTKNSIVMPGMINSHAHSAMSYFRGIADDLPLDDWLKKHIWPAEAKCINPKFVSQASSLACLEMLKSGVTCFNDMYFFERETILAATSAGMRIVAGEAILDFPVPNSPSPADSFSHTEELIEEFRGSGLALVAIAPHSVYACSEKTLKEARAFASLHSLILHIHVSETRKEVRDCLNMHKKDPVSYLEDSGILDGPTIAAHSVWLSEDDFGIYAKRDVKISQCPKSNMKLASGTADYRSLSDNGIVAALGTDSAASNNTLDLFSEMRFAALVHKAYSNDPTTAPAIEIVKMATINGAKALGLEKNTGSLEIGKKADIITINLDKPHLAPLYDPYSHLVYAVGSADVENVFIAGGPLMRNRKMISMDEERIISDAKKFSK